MSGYGMKEGKKPTILLTSFVRWSKTNLMHGVAFRSWPPPPPSQSSRREQPESLTFIRRRRRARYKFGNQEKGISISKRTGELEGDERPLNADGNTSREAHRPSFLIELGGSPKPKLSLLVTKLEGSKSSCVNICTCLSTLVGRDMAATLTF